MVEPSANAAEQDESPVPAAETQLDGEQRVRIVLADGELDNRFLTRNKAERIKSPTTRCGLIPPSCW